MHETESELRDLQTLLDASLGRSTAHLRSIISDERSLTAQQTTQILQGMCVLVLSTVTAKGEPRVSAVDGHFLHGRWVFGTARGAAKARHLRARPAASVAHLRGEDLGVFVHGTVETIYEAGSDASPDWPRVREHLHGFYGEDTFDSSFWDDVVYYRLRPTWMTAWSMDPARLLAEAVAS